MSSINLPFVQTLLGKSRSEFTEEELDAETVTSPRELLRIIDRAFAMGQKSGHTDC